VNRVMGGPVAEFEGALRARGYSPFPRREPLRIGGGG